MADVLHRTGVGAQIGAEHIFVSRPEITASLDEAWEHANEIVGRS